MFMMVFTLLALNSFIVTGCPSSTSTPSYAKCALNLGISDPVSCISYQCGGSNCDQCSSSTINSCLSCASGYDYYEDLSLCTRPDPPTTPVNPVIKPTQTSTSVLLKVYNAITKGSTTGFSVAVAGKISSNIKYLDIGYSSDLQRALKEWKSSFVSNRNNDEWEFRGINTLGTVNGISSNQLSSHNLPDNQESSLIDLQRKINRHYLNKRYNNSLLSQEQQNQRDNDNSNYLGHGNNGTLQSQMHSHHENLDYSQRQTVQRRRVKNIRNKERT